MLDYSTGPVPDNYAIGDIVTWRFVPGIVVASFFASLVGTFLCVEVLHRKRLGKNLISRVQLLSCALAMGLIGIWCMHFIGNRSIVLGNGADDLQMSYSPGFTFLSCVLPVVGLSFAFYIAELRIKNIFLRRFCDLLTGFLAGLSIVGMHYVGNLGAINYDLIYPARYIIASCIIAIGDCIIALMLFFYFKEQWISVLWKRLLCAVLLSVAVCGMHYTASIGCTYRLKLRLVSHGNRNTAVIVAGALCVAAALVVLVVLYFTSKRDKALASKAQQVMLACAYFDDEGSIMVTNEGLLPSQKVAKRFNLRTFDEEFNTGHPVFHWIWKVSSDWGSVSDLISKMRIHLRRMDPYTRPGTSGSMEAPSFDEESADYDDQTLLFREGFCVAAADLADRLHVDLEQLGMLYDRVTGTGSLGKASKKLMQQGDAGSIASSAFLEKGQLLFFTRKLSKEDSERFISTGYRFAPPNRVEAMIGRMMQIPHIAVAPQIKSLQAYASEMGNISSQPKQGTYLTCFAALGRLTKQFDVLVSQTHQDQLPDMQLAPQHLNAAQLNFLKQYDGWSAGSMVQDLKQKRSREQQVQAEVRGFILLLINSLSSLAHQISEEWFTDLTFNAKPVVTVYGRGSSAPAMILGLTKLLDIHQGMVKQPDRLTFVSLEFFRVRTAFYPGCADVPKFRSMTHAEFGPILNKSAHDQEVEKSEKRAHGLVRPLTTKRNFLVRKLSVAPGKDGDDESFKDNISERGLVSSDTKSLDKDVGSVDVHPVQTSAPKGMWGGILATTDTVIVESTVSNGGLSHGMEMRNLQPRVTATAVIDSKDAGKTFADLLYSQAKYRGTTRPSERVMDH